MMATLWLFRNAGYVKTDMNKGEGDITGDESARGILQGERAQHAQQAQHAVVGGQRSNAPGGGTGCAPPPALPGPSLVPCAACVPIDALNRDKTSAYHDLLMFARAVLEGGGNLHGRFYTWAGEELPW